MPFPTLREKNVSSRLYDVYLKISEKLLIPCNLMPQMYTNGDVGTGYLISCVKYISPLVDASLLDIPGILLCSGKNPLHL